MILSAPLSASEAELMRPYFSIMEGDYQASWETLSGINLKGWALAPLRGFRVGGSNSIETGVKNLRGIPGRLGILAKLDNGFRTMVFTAQFLPDANSRDKFAAEAVPCARGSIGSGFRLSVAGNLCPIVLFNKRSAAELTIPERCYWAASVKALARITGPRTPAAVFRNAHFVAMRIRSRAITCIAKMGIALRWSHSEIEKQVAAVSAIKAPANQQNGTYVRLE